jgi:hypothetical protein
MNGTTSFYSVCTCAVFARRNIWIKIERIPKSARAETIVPHRGDGNATMAMQHRGGKIARSARAPFLTSSRFAA